MSQCTFKPRISAKEETAEVKGIKTAMSGVKRQDRQAKGYQQAVDRIKKGYTQNQELKENRELRQWKRAAHFNGKLTQCNPPKFHYRSHKQPEN